MNDRLWLHCPVCGGKTRNQVRPDTVLVHYPLFCPKCRQEVLINVEKMNLTVVKEPDAETQSQ